MTSATILSEDLDPNDIEAVRSLLMQAGFDESCITVAETLAALDPDLDDGVVLVLGTPARCANSTLETQLAGVAAGLQRAIWLWPASPTATTVPAGVKKYCYSIVPWDVAKLRAVMADDDVTHFEQPDGVPMPKVDTERNLCVDEDALPKPE